MDRLTNTLLLLFNSILIFLYMKESNQMILWNTKITIYVC
jgi:hypothetical protein